ncbi:MAG: hypothetical protein C0481_15365 [Phenylobacterium sp.]|nr:hypothetical protein [Phenylobacterium sp.]
MKLEDIVKGNVIAGVVPGKLVRVVAAEMRGADALELVYKAEGALGQRRLSRVEEDGLLVVSNRAWRPTPGSVLALLVVVLAAFAAYQFLPHPKASMEGPVVNDIPVVIRTNGGMLEVAKVKHRRTFNLTEVATFAGFEVPFCTATASYTFDAHTTYRVKLAKDWAASYRNQRLQVTAPRLEPALPVAFDTARLKATLEKCPFMPGGTQEALLRSIGGKLAKDASNPAYLDLARNGGARETVREFAQKWLINQKTYNIPPNTPIDVMFADE